VEIMPNSRHASDAIEIPASALQTKAWFVERPDDSIRKEILQFIRDRNPVYLCKYHTHTKPPKGARIEYIGEFDVHQDLPMAPCPCCSPVHPKYRESGKIAWFPDERVIRLIGPDCFKTLNPEGHKEALRRLSEETQHRQTTNYLLGRASDIPKAIAAIRNNLQVAAAVDRAHSEVMKALRLHKVPLWDNIRSGIVVVDLYDTVTQIDENGKKQTRETHSVREVGIVSGVNFYNPSFKAFAPRFKQAQVVLAAVDLGTDYERAVREASDHQRDRWATAIGKGVDKAARLTEELQEVRRGLSPEAVSTIRRWGAHEGTKCFVFAKREGNDLLLGRTEEDYTRLKRVMVGVWEGLDPLPDLGTVDD
jgi:hypothetical protein